MMNLRDPGTPEGFAWRWLALALGTVLLTLFLSALVGCDADPGGAEVQAYCESQQGQEECFLPAGRCGYYNWSDSLDFKLADTLTFCLDMHGQCAGVCAGSHGNQ